MSPAFDRMKRNGQAACGAVRGVPRLLSTSRVDADKRRRLAEAIDRNRREIDELVIQLSAEGAEPRVIDLARKIEALWTGLYALVEGEAGRDESAVAA